MRTENKIDVEVVVGLINRNRDKTKRQFNLSRQAIEQLQYIYDDQKNDNNLNSYSSIIEQALNAYHSLYMYVKELEEKGK